MSYNIDNSPADFPHLPHVYTFAAAAEDFEPMWTAEAFANDAGLTSGSSERGSPTALFRNAEYVSKWRGLSAAERNAVDGVIVGDHRHGPVFVCLREPPQ